MTKWQAYLVCPPLCPLHAPLPSLAPSALSLVASSAFLTHCGRFVYLVRHSDVALWRACFSRRSHVLTCRGGGGEGEGGEGWQGTLRDTSGGGGKEH